MTATDFAYEEQAKTLSETPSETWHLLPIELSQRLHDER